MEATLIPLPTELTTPPVTKMYLALIRQQTHPYHGERPFVLGEDEAESAAGVERQYHLSRSCTPIIGSFFSTCQ